MVVVANAYVVVFTFRPFCLPRDFQRTQYSSTLILQFRDTSSVASQKLRDREKYTSQMKRGEFCKILAVYSTGHPIRGKVVKAGLLA